MSTSEVDSPPYAPASPPYAPASPPYAPASPPYAAASPASPPYAPAGQVREKPSPLQLHSSNPNTLLSRKLLETYFKTFEYPFTRHHIDSFDQFVSQDIPAMIKSNNPFLILKELIPRTNEYMYRVEIFVGGLNGDEIEIGTPTLSLQKATEVRVLFPNEARLRNLTYASTVYVNVTVRITLTLGADAVPSEPILRTYKRMPLFVLPILLHSRFCILHKKPSSFLKEAGECPQDQGGYFIVEGSEKVLVTRQEQAFNTLYVQSQANNDKVETYGNITCLSSETRQVKVVTFNWMRSTDTLLVTLPYVRKPVPLFLLFRAMGIQSDHDILSLIYPDLESAEAKLAIPYLIPSIAESFPFMDTYSAVQFIKAMTKGFSEEHVYDILFNQTFIHITEKGISRAHFLAECVRRFMRVHLKIDPNADRDDTRNQRALTSGSLIRMLFANAYNIWKKAVRKSIDEEYAYHADTYSGEKFVNVFSEGNTEKLFNLSLVTQGIMRGFKGKWVTGGAGGGGAMGHSDEKSGVLQAMSRISYLDFISHTRRVILNFDTGMKLTKPRQLHTSQYGYFCTNETPGGASIGISKNLSLMTLISVATDPAPVIRLLIGRSWIIPCSEMRNDLQRIAVPLFLNNGIIGYTFQPFELTQVLKLMKWTGCLPAMSSMGFSIRNRRVFLFLDEGRPMRPLIHLDGSSWSTSPIRKVLENSVSQGGPQAWRNLVLGFLPQTSQMGISSSTFIDPLADLQGPVPLTKYKELLESKTGVIEYVDPYEQNEAFIVNFPEHVTPESSHMEIHPCTIVSAVNGMIPFANFNQSPRNQLSCSQSKQALGMYATNFQNRYDNTANILCYGEAPLVRTLAYDVLGEGLMPYGHNLIMAIMPFQGYNQDDGIIFNEDAFQRGMFRNMNYRSYTCYEENDKMTNTRSIVANPLRITQWTDLKPGLDYTKLDDRGIIKVGELVDEQTVLVGKYIQDKSGKIKDASLTAQVWTTGRVESVIITVNNQGLLLVKVRITQDRTPELGDKFSTRHGQKGTIGMRFRAHDLPRGADGMVPDMLVNPHCIPSRMTVAQLMEMIFGEVCYKNSMIGDATIFMSDSSAPEAIGRVLEGQFGMEKTGNHILYDGASGVQIPTTIFLGPVFTMRLKHMVEDKWNARAEGRREQKTHQPTGGRGSQGGLRIGEMERDALAGHGITRFLRESLMERADITQFRICNGCGTVPIFNARQNLFVCPLCDGPVSFVGAPAVAEILPSIRRSLATTAVVEMPYATKLLAEELQTYMNMGIRILTAKSVTSLHEPIFTEGEPIDALPNIAMPETKVPEYRKIEEVVPSDENLYAMGVVQKPGEVEWPAYAEVTPPDAEAVGDGTPPYAPMTPPEVFPAYAPITPPLIPQQPQVTFAQQPQVTFAQQPQVTFAQQPQVTFAQQQQPQQQQQTPFTQPAPVYPGPPQQGGWQWNPAPIIYQAPVPNGPPTIVVDTRPQAGWQDDQMQEAQRGGQVMGRRRVTPRLRPGSPKMVANTQITPTTKITINKLG